MSISKFISENLYKSSVNEDSKTVNFVLNCGGEEDVERVENHLTDIINNNSFDVSFYSFESQDDVDDFDVPVYDLSVTLNFENKTLNDVKNIIEEINSIP